MPTAPLTFKVYGPGRDPIPADRDPRLWIRLVEGSQVGDGLIADVEKRCNLDANGVGSVSVESHPGVMYQFVLDWLSPNPAVDPDHWRRKKTSWPPFFPGPGGDVSALLPYAGMRGVIGGFGPVTSWPQPVIYLDLADPDGIGVYGPAGMLATEGGA